MLGKIFGFFGLEVNFFRNLWSLQRLGQADDDLVLARPSCHKIAIQEAIRWLLKIPAKKSPMGLLMMPAPTQAEAFPVE